MTLSPLEGENHIGSASTQTAAKSNLILTPFPSYQRSGELERQISHAGFYQGIVQTLIRSFKRNLTSADLAAKLASIADHAHTSRQFDLVGCVGKLLLELPFSRRWESVAHYYEALSLNRGSRGDTASAGTMFEQVADKASLQYRARAMLALGANSLAASDNRTATFFYREAMRIGARDDAFAPATLCFASWMTAVVKAMEGDHRGALADLESMFPLVRLASSVQPYAYYEYLNTLAVELTEAGRLEEARNASRIVLASPFASAYPEWRETRDEIQLKGLRSSRSVVAFGHKIPEPSNLVRLPLPKPSDSFAIQASPASQPARVLSLLEWKTKVPKHSNGDPQDRTAPGPTTDDEKRARLMALAELTTREKLLQIMKMVGDERVGDDQLLKVLIILEGVELKEHQGS